MAGRLTAGHAPGHALGHGRHRTGGRGTPSCPGLQLVRTRSVTGKLSGPIKRGKAASSGPRKRGDDDLLVVRTPARLVPPRHTSAIFAVLHADTGRSRAKPGHRVPQPPGGADRPVAGDQVTWCKRSAGQLPAACDPFGCVRHRVGLITRRQRCGAFIPLKMLLYSLRPQACVSTVAARHGGNDK